MRPIDAANHKTMAVRESIFRNTKGFLENKVFKYTERMRYNKRR